MKLRPLLLAVALLGPPVPILAAGASMSPSVAHAACADERAALRAAGVAYPYVERGVWLAWRESRCQAHRINPRTWDYGSWQFHARLWLPPLCAAGIACSRSALLDVRVAARAYRWVTDRRGTRDWCYSRRYPCPWGKG